MKTNVLKKLLVLSLAFAASAPLCAMGGLPRQSSEGATAGAAAGADRVPSLQVFAARAVVRGQIPFQQDPPMVADNPVSHVIVGIVAEQRAWYEQQAPRLREIARRGERMVVLDLIRQGVAVNAASQFGSTPLHYATRNDHEEVVLMLLAAGTDVNAVDGHGLTPLHCAAMNDRVAVVTALLAAGAAVNARDQSDNTPLHVAACWGRAAVVGVLLVAGANRNLRDAKGRTAADLAREFGRAAVATIIDRYQPDAAGGTGGAGGAAQ